MIVACIILGVIVLVVLFFVVKSKLYDNAKKQAEMSGVAYKKLVALNQKYSFRKYIGILEYTKRTNAKKYNSREYAFDVFVKEIILPNISNYEDLIKIVEYNKPLYKTYLQEYTQLICFAETLAEKDLCEEKKAKPCVEPIFVVTLFYTYYQEHRSNKYNFSIVDIVKAVDDAKRISANRTAAQVERSIMSDRLRFLVLKRDNFTCKMCGKKAIDGAELEVDHIVPVSKGGKTDLSNLQTLCKRCNRGKGDLLLYDDEEVF